MRRFGSLVGVAGAATLSFALPAVAAEPSSWPQYREVLTTCVRHVQCESAECLTASPCDPRLLTWADRNWIDHNVETIHEAPETPSEIARQRVTAQAEGDIPVEGPGSDLDVEAYVYGPPADGHVAPAVPPEAGGGGTVVGIPVPDHAPRGDGARRSAFDPVGRPVGERLREVDRETPHGSGEVRPERRHDEERNDDDRRAEGRGEGERRPEARRPGVGVREGGLPGTPRSVHGRMRPDGTVETDR